MITSIQLPGYEISKTIYDGTRTIVYRGNRKGDPQPLAIKILRNQYPTFSELVQFHNQYTIAQNLDFPGVVKPVELLRLENGYALVMEDSGSISLADYSKGQPLNLDQFFPIALQLADILHSTHQKRVIHKDIKPLNILIHPETLQVTLIDFSISSLLPRETQEIQNPNLLEGTLAYISPEQTGRMNRGIDYRSDFYGLGVTFYQLLTGELPFVSEDAMELVHFHLAKQPIPIHQINSEIPLILSEIVSKLMAKNAEDRYQTALGIKHDLETCLTQLQTTGKIENFELGERDKSDRFIIPEKLYGRENEVERLLAAFERVSTGAAEMMLVAGFSGIGKTAVVNEVHKPIVRQRGYFIKGKYDQFQRNIPFSAFVQAFRDLMGQLLSESDEELQRWKTNILEAVGDNGQVLIDVIPELENIIGQQPPATELSGSAAQNRFNLLLPKFVKVFASKEHPLVMFLDDLQWSDSASLNLLKLLMQDTEYLLVLGAYRDNEVSPVHPFILTVEEIVKNQATVNTITLQALSEQNLNRLIADTLNCELDIAYPLTQLVYLKTQGNPFFATQFLKALHDDKLISFDWDIQHWQCDIARVKSLAITDDVVEFMALQLHKLPSETQEMLKLAACIGAEFDLNTLIIVSEKSAGTTAKSLWKALQEGLVIPTTKIYKFFTQSDSEEVFKATANPTYRFLHDRVQQAAYSLIASDRKQATHLKIGQLLLAHQSSKEQEDNIFNIVNHLVMGIDADPSSIPVAQLAELAFLAGMKAKLSIAYHAAIDYFNFGLSRLPQEAWNTHYRLMFDLNREKAECDYLVGRFEESELILNHALKQVTDPIDAARIYGILMTQRTTQGTDVLSGVDAGIKGLAVLGTIVPTDADALVSLVKEELQQVREAFTKVSPQVLLELPPMRDPVKQSCMKLLCILWSAAYVAGNPNLNWLTTLRMINLSLKYGRAESSSFSYCSYGMTLAYEGRYREAYEFGTVALEVDRTFHNTQFIAKNNNHFGHAIAPYIRPIAENLSLYQQSFEICTELGDLIFGVWAIAFMVWAHLFKGSPLPLIEEQIEKYIDYVRGVNDRNMLSAFELKQQFVRELIDDKAEDGSLTYEGFLNSPLLALWRQNHYDHGINWYGFLVLQRLYLQGNYQQALQVAQSIQSTLPANFGFFPIVIYHVYYPLSLTAIYEEVDSATQKFYWQQIQEQQQVLYKWSQTCPQNFLHKYQLISAEMARIDGDRLPALELYDAAIAGAKDNEYLQEEALANELAAKFYLDWGKEKVASGYMQDAYYCYARWGAKAKVTDLEKRYPQLLAPILQQPRAANSFKEAFGLGTIASTKSSTSISEALDLATLLKASQAISGEIELDKLLTTLLKIVIANAGASKSILLLKQDGSLKLVAIVEKGKLPQILPSIPLESSQDLAISLVNIVKRNLKPLVLEDARISSQFAADIYIQQNQPKSVLCSPILNQGQLIGILYLENKLTVGAFTSDRVELLNLICAQAAISLENARLYRAAQQALQDLQQAQLTIVQSEKMSALGNLVAGVAHEINNPVGFLSGNINPALNYIQDIFGLLDLYQQKYPQVEPEIEEEIETIDLNYIREDFPKLVNSMQEGVKRIKDISTSLRTFSRADTDRPVACNIHDGIDSTLLILKHRLKANQNRPEIAIVKNYGDLPPIECYAGQLNQVFMNLLSNAIDALEDANQGLKYEEIANQITVKTELSEDKKQVIIRIIDNGIGMSAEVQAKIFEHLFTTKGVGKGTGLGLAISRQIVEEKHGGKITLTSEVGKGTEFAIALPFL